MASWPDGIGREILDIAESTNTEAKRRADSVCAPTWIMARRQTAGKGRLGRPWVSLPGNLAATLVMRTKDPKNAALRSFVAGLALLDACVEQVGRSSQFRLKWPNDLLLNGGKLAGILLECVKGESAQHLIIGFGVNLAAAPTIVGIEKGTPAPVSLVGETGHLIAPESFLQPLASAFDIRERQIRENGFGPVREEWLSLAAGVGATAKFRMANREIRGVFKTIDDEGNAIVVSAGQRYAIAAGEMILEPGGFNASGH